MCSAIWKVIWSCATCPPGLESCVPHNHLWLIWHCLWGFPSPNWPWVLLESNKLRWKDVQLVYMKKETGSQSNEETWVIWSCNCGWRESSRLSANTFAMEIQSLAGWVSSIVPQERLVSKAVTLWHVQYCPHCLCVRWEHWKPHSRQQVA